MIVWLSFKVACPAKLTFNSDGENYKEKKPWILPYNVRSDMATPIQNRNCVCGTSGTASWLYIYPINAHRVYLFSSQEAEEDNMDGFCLWPSFGICWDAAQ